MQVLVGDDVATEQLYAPPPGPWLRVNMVSTLDGSAAGAGGKTDAINNDADKRVFDLLRAQADAIVVGAGTARTEGYGPVDVPIVLVSRSAEVPSKLRDAAPGAVLMATVAASEGLGAAREALGAEHVIVAGDDEVDHQVLRRELTARGHEQLLCEGGPSLLGAMLAQGVVDELCCTLAPLLVGGDHPRIVTGPDVEVALRLHTLVEDEGTLLARWFVER